MPRTLVALLVAVLALIGAPAVAAIATLSSLAASDVVGVPDLSAAVWAWAGSGIAGLIAMATFGATVVRREKTRSEFDGIRETRVSSAEAPVPSYA